MKLQTAQNGDKVDQRMYRSLVGSVLYLQTDEARYDFHSQHSVRTRECTYQSTLAMRKTTFATSSRFKTLKLTDTEAIYD